MKKLATLTRVKNLEHLKKLIEEGKYRYYLQLNYGIRSSKYIQYDAVKKKFHVFNEADGSSQSLTENQLMLDSRTNIGKAMKLGALICEG